MSDGSSVDYSDFEDDVGLEAENKDLFSGGKDWLKMTKGQTLRASFAYFHTVDQNAVAAAVSEAKKLAKTLSKEEKQEVGRKAIEQRLQSLNKTSLSDIEKLDLSSVHFKKLHAHYQEGLGYVVSRLGKDGEAADAVWKKLQEPKLYFTTLLYLYPVDSDGEVSKDGLISIAKGGSVKVVPWRFSKKVYEEIWKLNSGLQENGLSLSNQDLRIECKDAQYQNISLSFVGACLWQKNEKLKVPVLTKALTYYNKLNPFREMTTEQLRDKLGLTGGSAVQDTSSTDFSDLLDNV